jgi:hypothetical protein
MDATILATTEAGAFQRVLPWEPTVGRADQGVNHLFID